MSALETRAEALEFIGVGDDDFAFDFLDLTVIAHVAGDVFIVDVVAQVLLDVRGVFDQLPRVVLNVSIPGERLVVGKNPVQEEVKLVAFNVVQFDEPLCDRCLGYTDGPSEAGLLLIAVDELDFLLFVAPGVQHFHPGVIFRNVLKIETGMVD